MQEAVVLVAPPAEQGVVGVHRLGVGHRLCVDAVDVGRALLGNDACLLLRQLEVLLAQLLGGTHVRKVAADGIEDLPVGLVRLGRRRRRRLLQLLFIDLLRLLMFRLLFLFALRRKKLGLNFLTGSRTPGHQAFIPQPWPISPSFKFVGIGIKFCKILLGNIIHFHLLTGKSPLALISSLLETSQAFIANQKRGKRLKNFQRNKKAWPSLFQLKLFRHHWSNRKWEVAAKMHKPKGYLSLYRMTESPKPPKEVVIDFVFRFNVMTKEKTGCKRKWVWPLELLFSSDLYQASTNLTQLSIFSSSSELAKECGKLRTAGFQEVTWNEPMTTS